VKTADPAQGRRDAVVCGVHARGRSPGRLSSGFEKSKSRRSVATDSVPLTDAAKKMGKIKVLSVADLLARGIVDHEGDFGSANCFI